MARVGRLPEHPIKRRGGKKQEYSQTVYNGSPLSFLLHLTLPLVHLENQLQKGALGGGYVSVSRPAQILELADHQVAFLRLTSHNSWVNMDYLPVQTGMFRTDCRSTDPGDVVDSEQPTDDVTVHRAGYTIHLHVTVTQHSFFWPVLRTTLNTADDVGKQQHSILKTTAHRELNEGIEERKNNDKL